MYPLRLLFAMPSVRCLRYITLHPAPPPLTQAPQARHLPEMARSLKNIIMADAIVEHVTDGIEKNASQFGEQCTRDGGPILYRLKGARARTMRFHVSDAMSSRKPPSVLKAHLHRTFLQNYQYTSYIYASDSDGCRTSSHQGRHRRVRCAPRISRQPRWVGLRWVMWVLCLVVLALCWLVFLWVHLGRL